MTVTAEDMQAKYDDPWEGLVDLQNQLNEKDEYINELEREKFKTNLKTSTVHLPN